MISVRGNILFVCFTEVIFILPHQFFQPIVFCLSLLQLKFVLLILESHITHLSAHLIQL